MYLFDRNELLLAAAAAATPPTRTVVYIPTAKTNDAQKCVQNNINFSFSLRVFIIVVQQILWSLLYRVFFSF